MIQFGIELEGYGLTKEEILEVMESEGAIHEGFLGYMDGGNRRGTHNDQKVQGDYVWKTTRDGSLTSMPFCDYGRAGHHEIVSPICYGREGQLKVESMWRALVKKGFYVDNTCGTHLTMGLNNNARFQRMSTKKKTEVAMRIAQLYHHFQNIFNALSPNKRNGGFHYCSKPNLHNPFNDRTSAVNLTNWALYGIVEFRQFGYTTDLKNFRGWMKVLDSILSCAFNENHTSYGVSLHNVPVTWASMAQFLNVGRAASRWGEDRILHLATTYRMGRENRIEVLGGEE
tara:strand:+ start:1657 stop:2511 length:855 start_codon:yes stop_codon:yes gene_type:complete